MRGETSASPSWRSTSHAWLTFAISSAEARELPNGAEHPGRSGRILCHEYRRSHTAVCNCTRDEGGRFELGNQVLISSQRKLLSSQFRSMVRPFEAWSTSGVPPAQAICHKRTHAL